MNDNSIINIKTNILYHSFNPHTLLIQPFDWAKNSSKPIFYPNLSIQWSNFKSEFSTRWTHVIVSTYHETWPILTKFWKFWLLISHNPTIWLLSYSQILDSGSRALWTCVILLEHQEILISHFLPIQQFDWAQNSSKPIF